MNICAHAYGMVPQMSPIVWIFYIDRQEYWKYDWTINICANTYGMVTQVTDSWASSDIGEVMG